MVKNMTSIFFQLFKHLGICKRRLNDLFWKGSVGLFDYEKNDQESDLKVDTIIFQQLAFSFCINKINQEVGLLSSVL